MRIQEPRHCRTEIGVIDVPVTADNGGCPW
jgi:hypothetical protein